MKTIFCANIVFILSIQHLESQFSLANVDIIFVNTVWIL